MKKLFLVFGVCLFIINSASIAIDIELTDIIKEAREAQLQKQEVLSKDIKDIKDDSLKQAHSSKEISSDEKIKNANK